MAMGPGFFDAITVGGIAALWLLGAGFLDAGSKLLDLPEHARAIYFYRDETFSFADGETVVREGDEVVVLARADVLPDLKERSEPYSVNGEE